MQVHFHKVHCYLSGQNIKLKDDAQNVFSFMYYNTLNNLSLLEEVHAVIYEKKKYIKIKYCH